MSGRLNLLCGLAGAGKTTLALLDAPVDELMARVAERNRTTPEGAPRIDPALVAFWDARIERPDAEELALFD